jgi:hypothetical protein
LPRELYVPGLAAYAPNVLPDRSALKQTVTTMLDAFNAAGIRPDQGNFFSWDPAEIVLAAFAKLGFDASPSQIRSFIAGYHAVGIQGQYDFATSPQRGLGVDSIIIVRWDPAKDTWVGVSKAGGRL